MSFDFDLPDDDEPDFSDGMTSREFRKACEEYAEWAVEEFETLQPIDLSNVTIEVSERMVRSAGRAGENRNGSDDWFLRIAFGAYEKWGWNDETQSTIRHELIHIRQYQENGTGDHGVGFKRMAEKVDCEVHCPQFTEFNYGVFCGNCDELVAGRYRRCKLTKNAEQYDSKCCEAVCYSEELEE